MNKTKQGVNNEISYSVSVKDAISDVKLWRIIINGYPYKTLEELGCYNKEEAYTATKQAIYCYVHGNNRNDYRPIGEAGKRTLNALNKILNDAENCTDTQISNNIKIIKERENFDVDNIENNYVSKTYSIQAGTQILNYKIKLKSQNNLLPEGTKITDMNNQEKEEFSQEEKFKILIPIQNLIEDGNFDISVETKIKNKPILYGEAENSSYQDYALTGEMYQDSYGETKEYYHKNETKVKMIKQDQDTKERLENVEFNIYDSNRKIIFANLKTNSNGEIQILNLLPGIYYIEEVSAKDGYLLTDELVQFNVTFNEELIITINNIFETIEIKEPEKKEEEKGINQLKIIQEKLPKKSNLEIKKLPVTGM